MSSFPLHGLLSSIRTSFCSSVICPCLLMLFCLLSLIPVLVVGSCAIAESFLQDLKTCQEVWRELQGNLRDAENRLAQAGNPTASPTPSPAARSLGATPPSTSNGGIHLGTPASSLPGVGGGGSMGSSGSDLFGFGTPGVDQGTPSALHFRWADARVYPGGVSSTHSTPPGAMAGVGVGGGAGAAERLFLQEVMGGGELLGGLGWGRVHPRQRHRKKSRGAVPFAVRKRKEKLDADAPPPHFTPCPCQGMCSKSSGTCTCIATGSFCEKYCACSQACTVRFQGCKCTKRYAPGVPLLDLLGMPLVRPTPPSCCSPTVTPRGGAGAAPSC